MPSKKLMGCWAFVDLCLLTAGILTLVLSIVWRAPDLMRNIVISKSDLTAGLVLGIAFLVTWVFSVGAIIQPNHVTVGLTILNWLLLLDGIGVLCIGTFIWYYTLTERADFHEVLSTQSADVIIQIQDKFSCCGYFNTSDLIQQGGTFCANQSAIDTAGTNNATCVGPVTAFADYALNNIFTSIYGYMAIVICLFLLSLCVINKRNEEERFRKIDEKRGGRGFV